MGVKPKRKSSKGKSVFSFVLIVFLLVSAFVFSKKLEQDSEVRRSEADFLPSFPGAEGFGAGSVGGRGGRIIFVTNTNESGAGSLRAAIDASGPRIIVFKTGGTITLREHLHVRNPYVTIAGQTAPGDGITLRGGGLFIGTHDVIVRGMRIRVGDASGNPSSTSRDGLNASSTYTGQDIYNVIVDHSSISWGVDENVSTWTNKVRNITYQYLISSEALDCSIHIDEDGKHDCHGMGMLLGGNGSNNISAHHNLFAHNPARNPRTVTDNTEIINNVSYDWASEGLMIASDGNAVDLNAIGNYFKAGRDTRTQPPRNRGIRVSDSVPSGSRIYVKGNVGPNRNSDSGDEWNAVFCEADCRRANSQAFSTVVTNVQSANEAYNTVLEYAGATFPRRDAIDERIISDVRNGTGSNIDSQNEVGGWRSVTSGTYPSDSDNDGIPNTWETEHNLQPNDASDALSIAPSGYMWIEEYVNSLIKMPPYVETAAAVAPTTSQNTFERRVWKSEDDAEQLISNGRMNLDSVDLDLTRTVNGAQNVGLRFGEIEIPQRAQILESYIEVSSSETSSSATSLTIRGQASDNPPSFSSSNWNLSASARPRTSAYVNWSRIPAFTGTNQNVRTPDIKNIVQQIVNRGGWRSGNSIVFILSGNGQRVIKSYDGQRANAPKLIIRYR